MDSSGDVIGLNLTKEALKDSNSFLNCTSMETQITSSQDLLYVSCTKTRTKPPTSTTFILIEINLIHDTKGYIMGMEVTQVKNNTPKDT